MPNAISKGIRRRTLIPKVILQIFFVGLTTIFSIADYLNYNFVVVIARYALEVQPVDSVDDKPLAAVS